MRGLVQALATLQACADMRLVSLLAALACALLIGDASARNELARGETRLSFASPLSCRFDADNPYPCCVNSPGEFGNCTGAAWQQMRAAGWGSGLPRVSWGDARNWRRAATAAGYLVDSAPSPKAVGVANDGPTLENHVAFVTGIKGTRVTTIEQQCGYLLAGGWFTMTRQAATFNDGYIRAPIPTVAIHVWTGALSASSAGKLTVSRGASGTEVTVNFGFSRFHANINTGVKGPSRFAWTINGAPVSTAGTFSKALGRGRHSVSVSVTNAMGVATIAHAVVVVR